MNQPVIEPVRNHFAKRETIIETSEEKQKALEFARYPLCFHRFGDAICNWSPHELNDDMLIDTIQETQDRLNLYTVNMNSQQKSEERRTLDACFQELQRRKLKLPQTKN